MDDGLGSALEAYGALPSQVVDLGDPESPRALPYVDLVRAPSSERAPLVIESQGQPQAYVFDGRKVARPPVTAWVRRIAFRGDAEWIGVLRPGKLDVFRAVLDGGDAKPLDGLPDGVDRIPTLLLTRGERNTLGLRTKLLELLRGSITNAKALGVPAHDALSLVGRGLFWRFLIDRGLLEGLDVDSVCSGAKSWPECMASKRNALRTFDWLDETFNGGLLPFESDRRRFAEEAYTNVLGGLAHGADLTGQLSLRLPSAWSEVNFAHVPVGLLSEVYEAFAHAESAQQAKAESIFYTPRHLAELMVEHALDAVSDVAEPRVLDPAAGAGVFLVAVFRALVAREWSRKEKRPTRTAVRRILNRQLVGFDINASALRLAELALYLTAIELDPDPRPRPLKLLHFEPLRERSLILQPGGVDKGSLASVSPAFRAKFDVVLGNPPWTATRSSGAKRAWIASSRNLVADRLGADRASAFELPDNNPDLPFVFRAMEWAKPGACIALLTHARWLFSQTDRGVQARKDLLQCVHVTGLLNGTALRDSNVWPNVRHPFCALFAANEKPPPRSAFLFVSPELERAPDRDQTRMRIDWQDAREIASEEVIARPWSFKARFRGGPFDEAALGTIERRGTRLDDYLASLGTALRNGYQVGGRKGTQQSAAHLRRLPDLRGADPGFLIETDALPLFERRTLLRPRPRTIYRAPLLLVHESMRVDDRQPRASLSLADVAYDERFDGASFADVQHGADIAAYLQIVILSSLFRHALLMLDGQFGVEREVVHLRTIESVPVVPWAELPLAHRARSRELSAALRRGMSSELAAGIDTFVFEVFGLSSAEREATLDTLRTALPTAEAKKNAVRATRRAEREAFASVCQAELEDVLAASSLEARVRLRDDLGFGPWRALQVDCFGGQEPALAKLEPKRFLEVADDASASLVFVRPEPESTLVAILDRYRYWTRTRARILAAQLLSGPRSDA